MTQDPAITSTTIRKRTIDEELIVPALPSGFATLQRMGLKPVQTAIAAENPDAVKRGLAKWQGAIDEVVIRAITAKDTVEDHLALVRAAAPV